MNSIARLITGNFYRVCSLMVSAILFWTSIIVSADLKRITFEGPSAEFKFSLKELSPELPSDWTPFNFLVIEWRTTSPQAFNLMLHNGKVARSARMILFPGAWIRSAVPLSYYKAPPTSGFDMASMGNKPRNSFWMGVGRPTGPLDQVEAIGVQMSNPVSRPSLEIRSLQLSKEDPGDAVIEPKPLVDEFGQWIPGEWPGKIKSVEELKEAWTAEDQELKNDSSHYCKYGGYLQTQSHATGFFRVEKIDGIWWFVDPDGHLFFSAGMDCVNSASGTRIQGREEVFAALPPADLAVPSRSSNRGRQVSFYTWNLLRRFGQDWKPEWMNLTFRRLSAWGFNTIANWSDSTLGAAQRMPYVVTLSGWGLETGWMGLPDVYSPDWSKKVDEAAARQCAVHKEDPWVLGYFVANEPPWPGKEAQLCDLILKGSETATQRQLKQYLSTGDTPQRRQVFICKAFERMLDVISTAVRTYDPNHLNLGIRFGGKPADEVVRLTRMFDVYSQNIYAHAPDHSSLDRIAELTGRPILIGEFHIGTPGRGLAAGLVQAADQHQRGVAYRYYVETAAAHPALIGTHWFQWLDQPATGRMDGENYNIGFVDVTDRPYRELVEAARQTHQRLLKVHAGQVPPFNQKALLR